MRSRLFEVPDLLPSRCAFLSRTPTAPYHCRDQEKWNEDAAEEDHS